MTIRIWLKFHEQLEICCVHNSFGARKFNFDKFFAFCFFFLLQHSVFWKLKNDIITENWKRVKNVKIKFSFVKFAQYFFYIFDPICFNWFFLLYLFSNNDLIFCFPNVIASIMPKMNRRRKNNNKKTKNKKFDPNKVINY